MPEDFKNLKLSIKNNVALQRRSDRQEALVREIIRQNADVFQNLARDSSNAWLNEFIRLFAVLRSVDTNVT